MQIITEKSIQKLTSVLQKSVKIPVQKAMQIKEKEMETLRKEWEKKERKRERK